MPIEIIVCVILGVMIVQNALWYLERRDLYNRIMCKDINEYKNIDVKPKAVIPKHRRILNEWNKKDGE